MLPELSLTKNRRLSGVQAMSKLLWYSFTSFRAREDVSSTHSFLSLQSFGHWKNRFWLTTADRSSLFALQTLPLQFSESRNALPVVDVNDMEQYQPIDGFGLALTGGSAQLLLRMEPVPRNSLLKELFASQGNDIWHQLPETKYRSDCPAGETDVELAKFSLAPDRTDVIPILKEILAIDPGIKILASPWSAPAWMKTNDKSKRR